MIIVPQSVKRITSEILEVKELIETNIVNKHRAKVLTGRRQSIWQFTKRGKPKNKSSE